MQSYQTQQPIQSARGARLEALGEKSPPTGVGIYQSFKKVITGGMGTERKSVMTKINMNKTIQYEVEENPFEEEPDVKKSGEAGS